MHRNKFPMGPSMECIISHTISRPGESIVLYTQWLPSIHPTTSEVSYVSPPSPSSRYDWHVQSPANPHYTVSSSTKPLLPQDDRPFHAHGWTEYLLPDESVYYVHQTYQIVTDVDLSDEELLDVVTAYLEDHGDDIPPGQEFWLQDVGPRGGGFIPLRCLVDHTKQSVMLDSLCGADGDCERPCIHRGCRDDRLDVKYRYWSFMSPPSHTSLPLGAHQDAMDALSWASTDGLLPSHRSALRRSLKRNARVSPPSFNQFIRGERRLSARTRSRRSCLESSVGANPTSAPISHYLQMPAAT
ncbi:hypothetical protein BD779DRAFT_657191 [Infundibulicybe gibba]|nr:hypothetical protein BD779DRAFT_657191 [Infundibulicybe gibba]